jgi:glutamate/aspartate transport system permease protein
VNYNWNWGIFFQTSPDGVHTYLETLLLGTGWTLATALSAWCLALAMGTLVGVIRTTPNPWLVRLGTAYVELFRNVPLLVQMFLWYFVLPELLATGSSSFPTPRSTRPWSRSASIPRRASPSRCGPAS